MKSYQKLIVLQLVLLLGLPFLSTQGFSQIHKLKFEEFKNSNSVDSDIKNRLDKLLEGEYPSVELTDSENFFIGEGALKSVFLIASNRGLYEKLVSLEDRSSVELIQINYQVGDPLPANSIFQDFPNLKYLIFQGQMMPESNFSSFEVGGERSLYLLIRNISAD